MVACVGAGAIGCYVTARLMLANPKHHVVRFGRRAEREAQLTKRGIQLSSLGTHEATDVVAPARFSYSTRLGDVRGCSYVFVAVKATQTEGIAKQLAALDWGNSSNNNNNSNESSSSSSSSGEQKQTQPKMRLPTIVSLQNGYRNATILRTHCPGFRVLASVVSFNVVRLNGDAASFHRCTDGPLILEADAESNGRSGGRDAQLVASLKRVLEFRAEPTQRIVGVQWGKLLINLINALNAVAGIPTKTMLMDRGFRAVYAAMQSEGLACLSRAGITPLGITAVKRPSLLPHVLTLPTCLFKLAARSTLKIDDKATSSMAQDLARGVQQTEIDELNGEIEALGRKFKVPTPVNSAIIKLIKRAEAEQKTKKKTKKGSTLKMSSAELCSLTGCSPPSALRNPLLLAVFAILCLIVLRVLIYRI
jgi:2-dehydropantoate 2-reductase